MALKTIDDLDLTPPDDSADLATWLARNFAILLDVHLTSDYARTDIAETFTDDVTVQGDVISEFFDRVTVARGTNQSPSSDGYWYKICDIDIPGLSQEANIIFSVDFTGHNVYALINASFRNMNGGATTGHVGVNVIYASEKGDVPVIANGNFKIIQTGSVPSSSIHNYELWGQVGTSYVGANVRLIGIIETVAGSVTWAGDNALTVTEPTGDYGSEFNATKGLIVDTHGNVMLGNSALILTSDQEVRLAKHIKFPASQVPSADPNTLDHYEEGEWDCILRFGGNSVGITYVGNTGKWTKTGNVVVVSIWFRLSNKGSSVGNATFSGVPFVQAASPEFRGGAAIGYVFNINSGVVRILGNQNNDVISFVDFGSSPLTETVFVDNSTIMFTYTYLID